MAGVTYRQLYYWAETGLLRPMRGGGSGHDDTYPIPEIRIAARIRTLRDAGLGLQEAATVARVMVETGADTVPLTDRVFITVTD